MQACISLALCMISMETEQSFGIYWVLEEPSQHPASSAHRGHGRALSLHHKQDFAVSLQKPVTFLWGEWTDHTLICHRSQDGRCHCQSTQDSQECSQPMPGPQRPQRRAQHDFWVNRTDVYPGKCVVTNCENHTLSIFRLWAGLSGTRRGPCSAL